MESRSLCFTSPLVVTVVSLLALVAIGLGGWPGEVGTTGLEFCEASRPGIIKQPANTLSNFGFIAAGLLIGWFAWRDRSGQQPEWRSNRMRSTVFYPALYAAVGAFLGPGSMAMHASTTWWGGKVDVFSMFLFIAFAIAYSLARLQNQSVGWFLRFYVPLMLVLAVYLVIDWAPGTPVFGILIVIFVIVEVISFRRGRDAHARRAWLGVAAAAFGVALAIWVPSRSGGPLCDPHSLVQGHAIWHLLSAVAVAAIFLFFRSEQPQDLS